MAILQKPIPSLHSKVLYSNNCSKDFTVVASKARRRQRTHNPVSNNETAPTQLSTDIKPIASNPANISTNIPREIFILQHALPWGGKFANKTASKRKRRVAERVKRRATNETSSIK